MYFLDETITFLRTCYRSKRNLTRPRKDYSCTKYPTPKNVTQLCSFLGLAGYYRRFIQGFSAIAQPLNQLLHIDTKYEWNNQRQEVFNELKQRLVTAPILIYPNYKAEFILSTDTSYNRFGATLSQIADNEKEHPIAYASKTLRKKKLTIEQ